MGLIIIGRPEAEQPITEKNPDCIVCNAERPMGFVNDIEKILHVLSNMTQQQVVNADSKMCAPHQKRARELKIYSSPDEYLELDPNQVRNREPTGKIITADEYYREEQTDVEVNL